MRKMLFALAFVCMTQNAFALDERCSRITEVDAGANAARALISESLTLSHDELMTDLNTLTEQTQDLVTAVAGCDAYFDDVLTQTSAALARLREAQG